MNSTDRAATIRQVAEAARTASRTVAKVSTERRCEALLAIAAAIDGRRAQILAANELDLAAGKAAGKFVRATLTGKKFTVFTRWATP